MTKETQHTESWPQIESQLRQLLPDKPDLIRLIKGIYSMGYTTGAMQAIESMEPIMAKGRK